MSGLMLQRVGIEDGQNELSDNGSFFARVQDIVTLELRGRSTKLFNEQYLLKNHVN